MDVTPEVRPREPLCEETEEQSALADPSGVKLGAHEIPPRVVAPVCALLMLSLALLLTFTAPVVSRNPRPWNYVSALLGWIYFLAWGASFLPQLYYNMRRRSVVGQSFDFVCLNILGFVCYAVYTLCFYANGSVQEMYKERHNGSPNDVTLNDVVFAVYALVCCLLNGLQIIFLDRAKQRVSVLCVSVISITCLLVFCWTCAIAFGVRRHIVFNYLDLLYGLSVIKLAISVVKYLPQIYLNFSRKSTVGWNIWNIVLDLTGGCLSVAQQVMDSWAVGRWDGLTGNPVKFALGFVSILYDLVFFLQHFVLYA